MDKNSIRNRRIMMNKFINKYFVTITLTLLAILNLLSNWGSLEYRITIVILNVVCGLAMEYLVIVELTKIIIFGKVVLL